MRPPEWPELLADYVESRRSMPFEWGANDCASFASAWVELMRGEPIELPPHASAKQAAQTLKASDGLEHAASAVLGASINPMLAKRGDIAMVRIGDRDSLSVVVGEYAVGPGADGIVMIPLADAVCAWTV